MTAVSVSIPERLSVTPVTSDEGTSDEEGRELLTIPLDVRRMIYRRVFSGSKITFCGPENQRDHQTSPNPYPSSPSSMQTKWLFKTTDQHALLLTCRQTYREGRAQFVRLTEFHIRSGNGLFWFSNDALSAFSRHHLRRISGVKLSRKQLHNVSNLLCFPHLRLVELSCDHSREKFQKKDLLRMSDGEIARVFAREDAGSELNPSVDRGRLLWDDRELWRAAMERRAIEEMPKIDFVTRTTIIFMDAEKRKALPVTINFSNRKVVRHWDLSVSRDKALDLVVSPSLAYDRL